VLYLCELLGIEHGVDLQSIIQVGDFISGALNRENLSSVRANDLELLAERKAHIQSMLV